MGNWCAQRAAASGEVARCPGNRGDGKVVHREFVVGNGRMQGAHGGSKVLGLEKL